MVKLMHIPGINICEGYVWKTMLPSDAIMPQLDSGTGTPSPI
jgi:hypothetical protein